MLRNAPVVLVCFSFFTLGALVYGQDAQVQGHVLDTSGAQIPKALVRVVDQRTSTERKTATTENGEFTVPGVTAGLYKIFVEAPGFSTAASDPITLAASQNLVLDFTLKVSPNSTKVLVTAEKREEVLLDVPVPVATLPGDTLAEDNQARLRDYFAEVPGINVMPSYVAQQNVSIRGITTGGGSTPTVGFTIDDVPFGASSGSHGDHVPDVDPGDLERIEVLRGPQGTLYGADSMGGLVKYVTVDPSTEGITGRLDTGLSNVSHAGQPGFNVRASANVPLSDKLAFRVSGFRRQDPGYIDNPIYNLKGVNDVETYGGHLATLWRPTNNVSLKISALFQNSRQNALDEADVGPGLTTLQQDYLSGSGFTRYDLQAYGALLNIKLGSVNLTALTGYNINHETDGLDFSFAFQQAVQSAFGVTGALYNEGDNVHKFTQELRFSVPLGRKLEWLVGGFYTHENDASYFDVFAENANTGRIVGTYWDFRQSHQPDKFEEYAAFTNLTYHVTNRFAVQVGGRESHLKTELSELIQTGPFIGSAPSIGQTEGTSANAFTYLVTPRFTVRRDLMVYARFASGYRPGTPNLPVPTQPREAKPDQTKTYEVGAKGAWLNQRLALDTSLYYIDWNNIQIQLTDPISHLIYNTNGSGAKSEGVEMTVTAKPATGLSVGAWAAYDNAVLTKAFPIGSPTYGQPGDRLPLSSRYSANVSLEKTFPVRNDALGYIGGEASYVGDRIGVFANTGLGSVGTAPERQYFPAYTKFDFRAGVRRNSWSAGVYVNNVADKRALVNGGLGFFYPPARYYITPRTIGLSVGWTLPIGRRETPASRSAASTDSCELASVRSRNSLGPGRDIWCSRQ